MRNFDRHASAHWKGSRGKDQATLITASSGRKQHRFSNHPRLKLGSTSPGELMAAAQAGSFSLCLVAELTQAGFKPSQVDTTVTVTMEHPDSRSGMAQIHLDVIAIVPSLRQCDFIDAALRAKLDCPVSRMLNATISLHAKLKRGSYPQLKK